MLRSAIPTRFQLPWAKNAGGPYIRPVPVASQIGIQDGAASFNDGFPPDCFTPIAAGGTPPFGQDMNGVMNATTTWDQWYQAGAPIPYDATFATAIGGYPQGAVLDSAIVLGAQWFSLVDNNLTNPDDPLTSINWARVGTPVGTPVPFLTASLPYGFATMNATAIGSAASGATYANANALFLFAANWSNSLLQIFDSSGTPTTRGANAVADFAANKRLAMPSMRGAGLIGVDTMGGGGTANLAGVPIIVGNTTTPGSVVGENLHALTTAELAVHAHANTLNETPHIHNYALAYWPGGSAGGGGLSPYSSTQTAPTSASSTGITITNVNAGSGGAHNNVPLNTLVYWGQKL